MSKRSQTGSTDTSEAEPDTVPTSWESWKRRTDLELESQFLAVKKALARLDREGRKKAAAQEPQESEPGEPDELDDQGKLNQIMGRRFFGLGQPQ